MQSGGRCKNKFVSMQGKKTCIVLAMEKYLDLDLRTFRFCRSKCCCCLDIKSVPRLCAILTLFELTFGANVKISLSVNTGRRVLFATLLPSSLDLISTSVFVPMFQLSVVILIQKSNILVSRTLRF